MKLWVDDIRPAPDDKWTVVKTITSAISAIENFDFDEVSLDHDISHQVVVGKLSRPYPCDECFCAVAHFIAAVSSGDLRVKVPKITIHTANPIGAEDMRRILAGYNIDCKIKMMGSVNRLEMEA